ncbi:DUF6542 domain-containing protein [Streptomyces sp. NPDC046862]|uniref:DUF6542 domain-containing protein n=1 Tax=Streptomyces sp. NPDC046862 TaxID=3154603 RepID=UPI00345141C4
MRESRPAEAARASGGGAPGRAPGVRRPAVGESEALGARSVRRMPNLRLTGLGSGLFCGAAMLTLGCLDRLLFGASLTVYGLLFLLVSALTAVWVRRGDLVTAPVVVPIAFAVGLLPLTDGDEGLAGWLVGLITGLATQAGWLYGGTLVAGVVSTWRKLRLMSRRRVLGGEPGHSGPGL